MQFIPNRLADIKTMENVSEESESTVTREAPFERKLLTDVQAAYHLGVTPALIYAYTQYRWGADSRKLSTAQRNGKTYYDEAEIDDFNSYLWQPWAEIGNRPQIPRPLEAHLNAESGNQCLRCGSGIGVETAHIEPWSKSRSHHHDNLVRICSSCHNEHDRHKSLSSIDLRTIKESAVQRTRRRLSLEMRPVQSQFDPPSSERIFVGRAKELETLCDAIREGNTVLVQGVGGIGKTQLLLQALDRTQISKRIVWLNMENLGNLSNVSTALALSTAELEPGESLGNIADALDVEDCLLVLDGGEQMATAGLDSLDDFLMDLRNRLKKTQIIVTSQVDLPRTGFDRKFTMSGLDSEASRRLLKSLLNDESQLDTETELLDFAEGHPLTLRLVASLVEYFGSGRHALTAINCEGTDVVEIPKRDTQNRETSLRKCLNLAYRMLNPKEQRLLFIVANCPGGICESLIERFSDTDGLNLIAGLRRWSLVQRQDSTGRLDRWYALSPIRSHVRQLWSKANEAEAKDLRYKIPREFSEMASAIELQTKEAKQVPYMVWRLSLEMRNLLYVTEQAETHSDELYIRTLASSVCSSLVRFFFILRLPEEGVGMMIRAIQIAMRAGDWKVASGYIAEAVSLAQRNDNERLIVKVERILQSLPVGKGDPGYIATAKAMLASRRGDLLETEKEARNAVLHYKKEIRRLEQSAEKQRDEKLVEKKNSLSAAYQILGFALLAKGKLQKASSAFESALRLADQHSRVVNEGQILYQLGRCRRESLDLEKAVDYFTKAAVHFQMIGMCDYIGNAVCELGYTILEIGDTSKLPQNISSELLRDAIEDAVRSTQQCIVTQLDSRTTGGEWALRKLFGSIVVSSLLGDGMSLKKAAHGVRKWLHELHQNVDTSRRLKRVAFEILHLEALIELMLSIVNVEKRIKLSGELHESDIEILVARCGSMGILPGLESSAFAWLEMYSRQTRSSLVSRRKP